MKRLWSRLGNRERLVVAGGAAVLLAAVLIQFAVVPFFEEKKKVAASLARQEKVLQEVGALSAEYQGLKRDTEEIRKALDQRPPGFTLFSHLERKAREAGVRQNIKAMNASRGIAAGAFEESTVDIRFEKLTLRQLVQFLHAAQSPGEAVGIRKISVSKSTESTEYLTALVQAVTYQRSGGSVAGAGAARPGAAAAPPDRKIF